MSAPGFNVAEVKAMLSEMEAEARELQPALGGSIIEIMAGWLPAQYALAAREKLAVVDGAGRLELLRMFVQDWALLCRGHDSAARLQLGRERLDWQRANGKLQKEQEFREWIQRPEIREEFLPKSKGGISPETLRKIEAELHLL